MTPYQQHGARTGQHTQKRQQAELPGCTEALEEMERAKPVAFLQIDSDLTLIGANYIVGQYLSAFFRWPERIEIAQCTNLVPWQDAATAALERQAREDAVFHCDICGAAQGTCECAWEQSAAERAAEMDGDRRGDEDRDV